tara:strand:- start:37104 stop:37781 length:678 start_codon:yes stop_codon:yes gene_type:complete
MTAANANALFNYPAKAAFGRVIPKSRIYDHARLTKSSRERFVSQVDRITWAYKLAPETINLPEAPGVAEIQVIQIEQRHEALDTSVLAAIDKAIPTPLVFQLRHQQRERMVAAFKRPSESDKAKWVVGEHFIGPWQPVDAPRQPLPIALNLGALYEQLLRHLIPHPARPGEPLAALLQRVEAIRQQQREQQQLEAQLQREKQFNRKVALHAQLRELTQRIEALTA